MLTDIEKEAIDLTKPFELYNSKIRLNVFEKLNLLERETVKHYQMKLNKLDTNMEFYKTQATNLDEF